MPSPNIHSSCSSELLIAFRETWDHMGKVSGYDPLVEALENLTPGQVEHVTRVKHLPSPTRIERYLDRFGVRKIPPLVPNGPSPSHYVTQKHDFTVRQTLERLSAVENTRLLLTAGESHMGPTMALSGKEVRRKVSVVFHQPPCWHRLHWGDFSALEGLANIICVSEHQAAYFRQVCTGRVKVIKHGVRHDFFTPAAQKKPSSAPKLLIAGNWFRDFHTLRLAMAEIWKKRPDVTLDCIVPRPARNDAEMMNLAIDERVRWHAGLSVEELRQMYQEATLLFLPLLEATANNALIEAMACGLPVISTDIGGVPDYLPAGAGALCRHQDPLDHANAVLAWLDDSELQRSASALCREWAVRHFDWPTLAAEMRETIFAPP